MPRTAAHGVTLRLRASAWIAECERAGLTGQTDRAKAIGVSRSAMSRLESGTAAPGVAIIAGIADAFGMQAIPRLFATAPDMSRRSR